MISQSDLFFKHIFDFYLIFLKNDEDYQYLLADLYFLCYNAIVKNFSEEEL